MKLHVGLERQRGVTILSLGFHAIVAFVLPNGPGRCSGRRIPLGRRVLYVQAPRIRYYHCADCQAPLRNPSFGLCDWDASLLCVFCDAAITAEYNAYCVREQTPGTPEHYAYQMAVAAGKKDDFVVPLD